MAKTKTKRRKVWVNDRDGVLSGTCEETRSDAEMLSGRPVPFLESRPGDVVLSREEAETAFVAWGYQLPTAKKLAAFLALRSGR